jgi:hypothetical protein
MTISLMPQSPPFVQFEQRAVEDRNASIAAGGVVFRDVDYVVVMQRGSRDTFEKEATEWLADIDRAVHEGTYPAEWAQHFRRQYEAFREGRETPVIGTHVREWPSLSKAQVETLISARCITVEDLATANEQTLQRIGMGARELQNKARAYLATRDTNKAAEKISALEAEIANRDTRIATLEQRLSALETKAKRA